MKVLIIEPCFEYFGGYFRAFGIANALSEKGVEVDLLLSSKSKFSPFIKKTKINKNLTQYTLPRIYINFFVTGRILRGIIACFFILFKKYDIIHTFAIVQFESNIPFLFSLLMGRKTVVDWDDYWTDAHIIVPIYNNFLIRNYLKFCEYGLQKYSKNATATSEFLINELEKIGIKNKIKIINGVLKKQFLLIEKNIARRKLGISDDEKIILTLGNTLFRERTVYLFKIFERINKADNSIKLYINKDPKEIIKEQAGKEKFEEEMFKKIKNIGFIPDEELGYYIGAADGALFTMGDSTLEKACFPTRIGTYLNGNIPIMTNKTDTEACNVLERYECAVIGDNMDDLGRKIITFLNDPEWQIVIKNNIKIAKEKLSWNSLIDDLIIFYKKI